MDAWKLAELHGALFSLLLKVDVLAAEHTALCPVQDKLEEALAFMEELKA